MSQLQQLGEKEMEGSSGRRSAAATKCIPRRLPKAGAATPSRKEKEKGSSSSHQGDGINSSQGGGGGSGSKRFEPTTVQQVEGIQDGS